MTSSALVDARSFVEAATLAIASLLPIINPPGGAPVFLLKTGDLDAAQRHAVAWRVARNCFALLIASVMIGAYVLDFFGLSVEVVRIAGGLVVCAIGWQLLNAPEAGPPATAQAVRTATPEDLSARAFYPLTLPLTVGPGAISVAITLGANQPSSVRQLVLTIAAHAVGMLVVAVVIYLCYRNADRLLARLGRTGTDIVTRLSAFILLCIGVQIIWNGLSVLLHLA
ncbi:MAG: MarC family protein [Proteobacteria bacterium]|nr:MarC family protein [Pseudomonadota bacterium]